MGIFSITNSIMRALYMYELKSRARLINGIISRWGGIAYLIFLVVTVVIIYPHLLDPQPEAVALDRDIYYLWQDGSRLVSGENPYARILEGDWRWNQKYSTYFPLFYVFSAVTQLFGFNEYVEWLGVWRHIFLLFTVATAATYFLLFQKLNSPLLGIFASLFWAFNRWTLFSLGLDNIDVIPIFLIVLSIALIKRYRNTAMVLFGASLAVKQIGVFMLPVYLIWAYQSADRQKIRSAVIAFLLIISVPLLTSLPFIFWNASGYFKSIIFSATRTPEQGIASVFPSIDYVLGYVGFRAKFLMLTLMGITYWAVIRKRITLFSSGFILMTIFIGFNSIFYSHYLIWCFAFVPFFAIEALHLQSNDKFIEP